MTGQMQGALVAYLREALLPLDEGQLVAIRDNCRGDEGEIPELVQAVVNDCLGFWGGLRLAAELGDLDDLDDEEVK